MKRQILAVLVVFMMGAPPKAMSQGASYDLEQRILSFASQYRINPEVKGLEVAQIKRTIKKTVTQKSKQKKQAKNKKTTKPKIITQIQEIQKLNFKLIFSQTTQRILPFTPEVIAEKLKNEVISPFCRDQNMKAKNIEIALLEIDEIQNPQESLDRGLSATSSDAVTDSNTNVQEEAPTAMEVQTATLSEMETEIRVPLKSEYKVKAQCVQTHR